MKAGEYWKLIGAPKVREGKQTLADQYRNARTRQQKQAAQVRKSNEHIAQQIELASGKRTGRTLFEHWMRGTREPYISQLVALCTIMDLKLEDFLHGAASQQKAATAQPVAVFRSSEGGRRISKTYKKTKIRTAA